LTTTPPDNSSSQQCLYEKTTPQAFCKGQNTCPILWMELEKNFSTLAIVCHALFTLQAIPAMVNKTYFGNLLTLFFCSFPWLLKEILSIFA